MVIWKYKLNVFGLTNLRLPKEARFLSIGVQTGNAVMWFLVEPDASMEDRIFMVYPTGQKNVIADPVGNYLGSFQIYSFVGHVFEIEKD